MQFLTKTHTIIYMFTGCPENNDFGFCTLNIDDRYIASIVFVPFEGKRSTQSTKKHNESLYLLKK